jgi:hypothetical protein
VKSVNKRNLILSKQSNYHSCALGRITCQIAGCLDTERK